MKFIELTNTTDKRVPLGSITGMDGRPIVFEPKETKKVSPATAENPAVASLIQWGTLKLASSVEVPAPVVVPAPLPPPKVIAPPPPEPKPIPVVVPPPPPPEPIPEPTPEPTPEPEPEPEPEPLPKEEESSAPDLPRSGKNKKKR